MTKFLGFQKKKQIGYKEERSKAVFCNLGGLYGKVVVRFGGH